MKLHTRQFGSDKAVTNRLLIMFVSLIILLVYGLFGNIEWLMKDGGFVSVFLRLLKNLDTGTETIQVEFQEMLSILSLKAFIVIGILPHIIVIGYYISYCISCKIFRKGVLQQ